MARRLPTGGAEVAKLAGAGGRGCGDLSSVRTDRPARSAREPRRHLVVSEAAFDALAADLEVPAAPVPELVELFELPRLLEP
jgi:hypothetical protein